MTRTLVRIAGIVVLAAAIVTPAHATPRLKQAQTGSVACNDGTVTWSPTTLWPPNHKMQTIAIGYTNNDSDGDSISVTVGAIMDNQASSDGSDELKGSGQPTAQQGLDWSGTGNSGSSTDPGTATTSAQVRAERSGTSKDGRTYSIAVTCSDTGGSDHEMDMQTVMITVIVPHDARPTS